MYMFWTFKLSFDVCKFLARQMFGLLFKRIGQVFSNLLVTLLIWQRFNDEVTALQHCSTGLPTALTQSQFVRESPCLGIRSGPEPGFKNHRGCRRNPVRRQPVVVHVAAGHDARPNVFFRLRISPKFKVI